MRHALCVAGVLVYLESGLYHDMTDLIPEVGDPRLIRWLKRAKRTTKLVDLFTVHLRLPTLRSLFTTFFNHPLLI